VILRFTQITVSIINFSFLLNNLRHFWRICPER